MVAQEKKKRKSKVQIRHIKINALVRETYYGNAEIPEIKFCGNWLAELGFLPFEKVAVRASNKRLIIRPV
jgi:hypothetical protein